MRNKKILICDDDRDILEMLEIILEDSGLDIFTEPDSTILVERIEENMPDLLLMDLWMPVITGDEILKTLRSNDGIKNLPVIIMSAAQDGKLIATEAGADDYISKPFDIDVLIAKVKALIQ